MDKARKINAGNKLRENVKEIKENFLVTTTALPISPKWDWGGGAAQNF